MTAYEITSLKKLQLDYKQNFVAPKSIMCFSAVYIDCKKNHQKEILLDNTLAQNGAFSAVL